MQQNHQGAAAARNLGAQHSQADILVFLDDDIVVEPGFLASLVREHQHYDRAVIMGTFRPSPLDTGSVFKKAVLRYGVTQDELNSTGKIEFIHCVSHNLSIKRRQFFEIGMFQDPTHQQEWPNWDDIDLAYRAYCLGFEFIQVSDALGSHIDYVLDNFWVQCTRAYKAGRSANWLFSKYPELKEKLPMFRDKNPINLKKDPVRLVIRKTVRRILALMPVLKLMEAVTRFLEGLFPSSKLLVELYRWINSTYIFRGYRFGLTRQQKTLLENGN